MFGSDAIAWRFQDSIEGRRLAADGHANRLREGKRIVQTVRSLYADHVHISVALHYAKDAGLITACEFRDADNYRMERGD